MEESVRELTPEKIQTIEERVIGVLNKTYAYEDAMNTTDDYGGAFRKHRELQTQRLINLTNSLKEFKYYQNVSLDNVTELEGKVKYLTDMELALDALVLKAKTKDFLKGKYPGFHESEANGYLSMSSEYFPHSHYVNRVKLDSLQKEIISQKWKGKFPEKIIDEHGELVEKSYTELEHHISKLDKKSEEYEELNIQYNKAKEIGGGGKGKFPNEESRESKWLKGGVTIRKDDHKLARPMISEPPKIPLGLFKIKPYPGPRITDPVKGGNKFLVPITNSNADRGGEFLLYSSLALLTIFAGRYISRQLNIQKAEEEKRQLNIQKAEEEKSIKYILEEFRGGPYNPYKDESKSQNAKNKVTSEQEKNKAGDKENPGSDPAQPEINLHAIKGR